MCGVRLGGFRYVGQTAPGQSQRGEQTARSRRCLVGVDAAVVSYSLLEQGRGCSRARVGSSWGGGIAVTLAKRLLGNSGGESGRLRPGAVTFC
ncbi:hypothetical protein NDU88_006817 [Pleurodeles waltl]|uniref:Uncharacterized protein n=1 Tax=Pleurodeles waltl TaxID=8319 RepID=A0AAV7UML2_PLEWA|nr:hypothetical protein NDU88_006817 [Pleurodeles waltl]